MKTVSAQTKNFTIVPTPQIITTGEDFFKLPKNVRIFLEGKKEDLNFTASLIEKALSRSLDISSAIAKTDTGHADLILAVNDTVNFPSASDSVIDQAYKVSINKNEIRIEARSAKGVFYGAMSLIQLLDKLESPELKCVKIIDWPDMKIRGISDDISRGQVSTLKNFKKIIRNIARYKMNVYMPYLEDMIQFPQYQDIGKDRGALSPEEIKDLVAYAKKYFIEVMPIFQTLGHYENILSQKKFLKYAEFPGAASLNVSSDSTYIFLESMLKEVFKLFPSKYFHMGADESFDVGLGKSKYLVKKYGIAKVHADHYKKIYDICKKYGKKVMMYGDIILRHPEILTMIPKDITIVDWHYRAYDEYSSAKTFNDAGFKYLVSPSVWNFATPFPTNVNALPNIKYIIKAGLENNAEGMINSNWGDFGSETFKELLYFGYAWSAQCSWNFKASNLSQFSKNLFYDFYGINDPRISQIYETLSNPLNQMTWNQFWRHPLLDFHEPAWWDGNLSPVVNVTWMNWTLPQILNDINALEPKVKRNKNQFELLRFIVNLDYWFRSKLQTEFRLHEKDYLKSGKNDDHVIKMIDGNLSSLKQIKNKYDKLWRQYYVKANLDLINDKFVRLEDYFNEIKDSLKTGNDTLYSPLIKSKWIYYRVSRHKLAAKAEFKKSLNLKEIPDEAYIQLIGNTYARLYINGKYVDEVYARRTLSLTVEHKRIKLLDIKKFLKKGKNTFLVKVENFNNNGAEGVNISSYFKMNDKILNINTNDDNRLNSWKGSINGRYWRHVVTKDYPSLIIAPNFVTKRSSWIER